MSRYTNEIHAAMMAELAAAEFPDMPVVIESDPYVGDPVASLGDSDEAFERLIASYHTR